MIGCRSNSSTPALELTLNLGLDPATIDPHLVTDPPTAQVDRLLFLYLTNLNEADGAPQPALAREWLVSSDGLSWEFRLRDDVSWVSYDPVNLRSQTRAKVTAQDVVYSVRRLFDPRTGSSYAHLFAGLLRNAQSFNNADPRSAPADLEKLAKAIGVTAKDDRTVQFVLTHPLSSFPSLMGTWLGRVVPQKTIEDNGINWTDPEFIWTSGPYQLERWDHSRVIVLRRNPFYFDASNVQIERLRFSMLPDVPSALDAYLRGELDTTDPYNSIEGDMLVRVDQDPALNKDRRVLPGLCTQYIGFNVTKAPFDDSRARLAFATALNREQLIATIFDAGNTARWFTSPQVVAAPDISGTLGVEFNAPYAKALLEGSAVGKRPLPLLTFGVNDRDLFINSAVAAVGDWKAALGAQITVEPDDWSTYMDKLRADAPPLFRLGYCGSYPDAANFAYDVFHSGSPYNFTHWSSNEYDRVVEEANRETDALKRRALYTAAEKILIEQQAVIIPLLWSTRVSLTKPNVDRTYAITEGYDRIEKWRIKP